MEAGMLLVFVRDRDVDGKPRREGLILGSSGGFAVEIKEIGSDYLSDYETPTPTARGLLVLEGWVHVCHGPEPEVEFVGEWRMATHWELIRLREGIYPWDA